MISLVRILLSVTYVLLSSTTAEAAYRPGAGYWCILSSVGSRGTCWGSPHAPRRLLPERQPERPEAVSYYADSRTTGTHIRATDSALAVADGGRN